MSFRLRLSLALIVAALLPLLPLLYIARNNIDTGVASLAPVETGEALQGGLELARDHLTTVRQSLGPTLAHLQLSIPTDPEQKLDAPLYVPPYHQLHLYHATQWYYWTDQGWAKDEPPVVAKDTEFGEIPIHLQVREESPNGDIWVLTYITEARFRRTAEALQVASADWAVSREQQDRLFQTLTANFLLSYAIAMILAIVAGLFVLRPLIRRIQALTVTAEAIRAGDEEIRAIAAGRDEVTRLARTFNLMLDGLADSRRHAAEMEKRAAWRELAPVLAHEIKNPLTPIQLSVQQLAESYTGDDERFARTLRTAREIVDEEIERLRKLVREFSDFARAPRPELADVPLVSFVRDLSALYGDALEVVTTDMPETACFDRDQIRRALVNLIENGFAAAGDEGKVRLTVEQVEHPSTEPSPSDAPKDGDADCCCGDDAAAIRILVEDSGPGVPDDLREKIFEPYMTTKSNGIGLGLPVVKSTVEDHGGRITISCSQTLNGARFEFTL